MNAEFEELMAKLGILPGCMARDVDGEYCNAYVHWMFEQYKRSLKS